MYQLSGHGIDYCVEELTLWSATPEDKSGDWNSLLVLPSGVDDGALAGRAAESRVRVGRLACHANTPWFTRPGCDSNILFNNDLHSFTHLTLIPY